MNTMQKAPAPKLTSEQLALRAAKRLPVLLVKKEAH